MSIRRSFRSSRDTGPRRPPITGSVIALCVAAAAALALPSAHAAAPAAKSAAAQHATTAFWRDIQGRPAETGPKGTASVVKASKARTVTLDRLSIGATLQAAPMERSSAARTNPLVIALPDPSGAYQRFAVEESPVMEPGLAAKHPEIKTYSGRGLDDVTANVRISVTPLGFQASVRSKQGSWYIDPYYHLDESLYASYYRRDVRRAPASFAEALQIEPQLALSRGRYRAADTVEVRGAGFMPGAQVVITVRHAQTDASARQTLYATAARDGSVLARLIADPYKAAGTYLVSVTDGRATANIDYQVIAAGEPLLASTGPQLRTYRLALLTDPAYASYFGGATTAAKVALVNRVTQIYEYETSIRLVLIANNDVLNLDTAAQFSGANGPCGGTACYPSASVSCSSATLTRTRLVIGLLAGASNFDIGHIAVGAGGGGIASLGVVGQGNKAQGCTGLPTPTGDLFAVDYVAHEMGHQFAGNHTFNGTVGSCSGGNRSAANSVEPGSGSSIMAYAGICGTDNLQPHSDPYFSQRSFDEITTYTSGAESNLSEVQYAVLSGFTTNGQTFQIRYNGSDSAPITRGVDFTIAGVKAAIEAIPGWPAGGTVTISTLGDTAFTITFGGTLAGVNVSQLELVNPTGGATGKIGEVVKGSITTRQGSTITATGNAAPTVTVPAAVYTIPLRTPFALTGSAVDADGDTITYLWEQTDRGAATGTSLTSNTKTNGPLFRQFGTIANVTSGGTLLYNSPGENAVTTNPTRVFPDMAQVLANNTNAETGACPAASATPTAAEIDCFSEYLPTSAYVGFAGVNAAPLSLNFRVTARDGRGGVNSGNVQLQLATGSGPFLVTSPNTAVTVDGASFQTITWSVANTDVAPVSTANVKISLSLDGGTTWPIVMAASTPNSGSKSVQFPNVNTAAARVKIEAVGNVFFDVSNANFTIRMTGDLNSDGQVDCGDLNIIRASFGKSVGQPGFDPRADTNNDGIVNVLDLVYISQRVTVGVRCPV